MMKSPNSTNKDIGTYGLGSVFSKKAAITSYYVTERYGRRVDGVIFIKEITGLKLIPTVKMDIFNF